MTEYLEHSPRDYDWAEELWSTKMINAQFEKDFGRKFGNRTIERLLKDAGYSSKRARKTISVSAPSKEEKLVRVKEIANEILELAATDDMEVVFLDESHFSNDLMQFADGIKKGSLFPLPTPKVKAEMSIFGAYASERKPFFWKSSSKSNTEVFKPFLHQLLMTFPEKIAVVILDNASIHSSKYIRNFLLKYPDVKLFNLPPYSLEYNPAEQVWRWLKPLVHGAKTIESGCEEIR